MALFWEEWKKCWRGRTAPLCLLALLAAAVCLGVYTGVDALSDMDRYYQPMHNGPREAARQKEFAGRWAGRLEAEELEKALKNLQHAYAQNGNTQEQNGVKAFTPQARRQWYDPVEAVVPLMESVLNISGATKALRRRRTACIQPTLRSFAGFMSCGMKRCWPLLSSASRTAV